MNEIAASERRLSAALDRIDQLLESGPTPVASAAPSDFQAELDAAKAENQRLLAEIAALRDNSSTETTTETDAIPATNMGEQVARLAAANEELTAANHALMDAAENGDVDPIATIRKACDAEIEALRAARFAEVANLAEIMGELDRLLGQEKAAAKTDARDKAAASKVTQSSFSGIYGDAPESDGEEESR